MVTNSSLQARSSSQRKELFKDIQMEKSLSPVQLLLDMKVRWGSTYIMLHRADTRKEVSFFPLVPQHFLQYISQAVNDFVYQIGGQEKNHEKRRKIQDLQLSESEWERVGLFCDLLSVRHSSFINYQFKDPLKR